MIVVSHPTGNQFVRAVLAGFESVGVLGEFDTAFSFDPDSMLGRLVPAGARRHLARRHFAGIDQRLIRQRPWRELARLTALAVGLRRLTRHETGWASVDGVYRDLDAWVAERLPRLQRQGVLGIYAYEDEAFRSFAVAGEIGMRKYYDLPIGYWRVGRALMQEEAERSPEWAPTLTGNLDSASKLERKDAELEGADVIFVASSFTQKTLSAAKGAANKPVVIAPYGAPPTITEREFAERGKKIGHGPLRALFVGSLTQRKGIAEVFAATRRLHAWVELTVIGRKPAVCPALEAALKHCRYIPSLPHHGILQEMRRHDVLLFPSLFEGFGLVILEAMAQGLPVITTSHTAGPDVLIDGREGFIVPIRSVDAIIEKLVYLLRHPRDLQEMARKAVLRAQENTWADYAEKTIAAIREDLAI